MKIKKLLLVCFLALPFIGGAVSVQTTKLTGSDENYKVDVIREFGINKLYVKSTSSAATVGDVFFQKAANGTNTDLSENCDPTNQTFVINAEAALGKDIFVEELRFTAFDAGIQIDKFLGLNTALTNGVLVRVTSEGSTFDFFPIMNTADFDGAFSFGLGGKYSIFIGSGNDYVTATYGPPNPFVLRKGTADKIEVFCRDDMSSVTKLEFTAFGFKSWNT